MYKSVPVFINWWTDSFCTKNHFQPLCRCNAGDISTYALVVHKLCVYKSTSGFINMDFGFINNEGYIKRELINKQMIDL